MKVISAQEVHTNLTYPDLVFKLKEAYGGSFSMPPRNVFLLDQESSSHDAFALLPSWNDQVIGVKAFTYFPHNTPPYDSLYSKIMLFDRPHGVPLALVDGTTVTFWRTAGISALASHFLSRHNAENLLLLGTGNLARFIIRAHISVRALERITIWGRDPEKAQRIIDDLGPDYRDIHMGITTDLEDACQEADIIVSATGSPDILVRGAWVQPGTHTDFLGNHHADKRECDTDLIVKSKVYVDTRVNCFKEAGEILVPVEEGVFSLDQVLGELTDLCQKGPPPRDPDDITLFKSVGSALSDLVTANHVYQTIYGN